jgi:hypothetical protein
MCMSKHQVSIGYSYRGHWFDQFSTRKDLEYVSPSSTAIVGNYWSRKRVRKPLAISNHKKKPIEKSISNTENSEKPQLLPRTPKVISTYRRCTYCSTKKREKGVNIICNFCCAGICVKNCFLLYHQNYVY